ncbi:MAG: O-antigen ligase family protein [Microbacteriaceae bacterium]|nr:O-antigen ligase family protein [Microbacteriaceae bacterium]
MSDARREIVRAVAVQTLGSARFSQAVTRTAIALVFLAFAVRSVMGWPGEIGALITLAGLAALSLAVKRSDLEWRGLLPLSLLVFLGWSAVSVFWSDYRGASVQGITYQLLVTFLAVYVSLTRDLIQVIRAFGDVLRVILLASLSIEVLSGILLNVPIRFLSVAGNIAEGGPIQGLLGSRNALGLTALIALITFIVERRSRSIPNPVSGASIAVALITIYFTRSPVTFGVLVVVVAAAITLAVLRRREPVTRRALQFVLTGSVLLTLVIVFIARMQVIAALNAGSEFELRYFLWRRILGITPLNTIEGFGWIGFWRHPIEPYFGLDAFSTTHETALNGYIDVLLQLGIVGLCSFVAFVGLTLVRAWLLASNKRSVDVLWLALMIIALLLTALAESSILVESGWFTLVICSVKAAQGLSWRLRLPDQ